MKPILILSYVLTVICAVPGFADVTGNDVLDRCQDSL